MHSRTSFQARILSGIAILLFTTLTLRGATYSAASANVTDIQSKINLARDGDTVIVPAGTARWTARVEYYEKHHASRRRHWTDGDF